MFDSKRQAVPGKFLYYYMEIEMELTTVTEKSLLYLVWKRSKAYFERNISMVTAVLVVRVFFTFFKFKICFFPLLFCFNFANIFLEDGSHYATNSHKKNNNNGHLTATISVQRISKHKHISDGTWYKRFTISLQIHKISPRSQHTVAIAASKESRPIKIILQYRWLSQIFQAWDWEDSGRRTIWVFKPAKEVVTMNEYRDLEAT